MPKQKGKTRAKKLVPYNKSAKPNSDEDTSKVPESVQDDEQILKCDKCKGTVEGMIQCKSCLLWHCCTCGNFPLEAVEVVSVCKTLHWFCEMCDSTASTHNDANTGSGTKSDTVSDALPAITKVITTAIGSLQEALKETITSVLNPGHRRQTPEDEMDIEDTGAEASLSFKKTTSEVITSFLNEEKERSKRRFNVILHNVEESSGDNGQVRKEQDVNKATSIFNEYMGIKPTVVNALRIGKKRDAGPDVKPRLLKLTLASEQDKASLLRVQSCETKAIQKMLEKFM